MRLGAPWVRIYGYPVYYPWRLLEWWYVYESYAPAIFNRGGAIFASSGLLAALTSFITGVTEPIEFTFMFIAPVLYAIHAVLTGQGAR